MLSRLKFDIKPLVNEMLDRLPADVWTRDDVTFLDPAMAGGQFIVEICNRLQTAGHSWENIETRVVGLADSPLSLNFTKNKYKIRGQFSVGGIETLEQWANMGKKFDVVIGNPPYQDGRDNMPKSHNLWGKISELAITLAKDGGYVCFITPASWMSPSNTLLNTFKQYHLLYTNDVKHHFPAVGSTFSSWSVHKVSPSDDMVTMVGGTPLALASAPYVVPNAVSMSIHNKVCFSTTGKLMVCADTTSAHSTYTKKKPDRLSKEKTAKHVYPVYHTNAQTLWSAIKTKGHDDKKVIFTSSGYLKPFYDAGTHGVSEISFYIPVRNKAEGTILVSILNSKLYQFIVTTGKWSGYLNFVVIRSLPAVDLTRTWTDAELYAHFNLTQEEIDLIEATVK